MKYLIHDPNDTNKTFTIIDFGTKYWSGRWYPTLHKLVPLVNTAENIVETVKDYIDSTGNRFHYYLLPDDITQEQLLANYPELLL